MLQVLQQRYKAYQEMCTAAWKRSNFMENFLGTNNAAKRHPCHEEFYEDVVKLVAEYAATQPSCEDAFGVCSFLLTEPKKYKDRDCYWFMYVMVGCIRELIPFMDKQTCRRLLELMDANYKKRERMPVQEDTYKKLKKAAK